MPASWRAAVRALSVVVCGLMAVMIVTPLAAQTQDILGVYFDTAGTTNAVTTTAPYQVVTAYLVLLNPSATSGVSAWECECDVIGPGLLYGNWTLNGRALNVQTPPMFKVGLGTGENALPWSPTVLLATYLVVVSAPDQEIEYYLHADNPASLQDPPYSGNNVACYADGADASILRTLHFPVACEAQPVATINADTTAFAALPTILPDSLGFGVHVPGDQLQQVVQFRNDSGVTLVGTVRVTGPGFEIRGPGDWGTEVPIRIAPTMAAGILFRYTCQTLGEITAHLDLLYCNRVVATVPFRVWVGTRDVRFSTRYLFFDWVRPGQSAARSFTVTNVGTLHYSGTMAVYPLSDPADVEAFTIVGAQGSSASIYLDPGETASYSVRFAPTRNGHVYQAVIEGAASIQLCGWTPADADVVPNVLDFGEVAVGSTTTRTFTLVNHYAPSPFGGFIQRQAGPFSLVEGSGDSYYFEVSTTKTLTVKFHPLAGGAFTDSLLIPNASHDLVCHGTALADPPLCAFTPDRLGFGSVARGSSANRTLTVRNDGAGPLNGTVASLAAPFHLVQGAGAFTLDPGSARDVVVSFSPTGNGYQQANLDLGSAFCSAVPLDGTGVDPSVPQDVIGIWFDQAAASNEYLCTSTGYAEQVVAYLLLLNPSAPAGIGGWDVCVVASNPTDLQQAEWTLEGQPVNSLVPPCFHATLSGSGLPAVPVVQLARFTFWHPTTEPSTLLYLTPTQESYADVPYYIDAANHTRHIPLTVASGSPDQPVAFVNSGSPVGVLATAPSAARTAGGVMLSWHDSQTEADAVDVYRRIGADSPLRLTPLPLPLLDGRLDYLDAGAGVPLGAQLRYSLGLRRGGEEIDRTPEAAITFTAIVPATTALHPARPNPFNPETTVSFDLARTGHARVEVFDCTGRRIRTLTDGSLAAGAYSRSWDGRDDTGRPVPSGVYYCRLSTGGTTNMQKLMLLR